MKCVDVLSRASYDIFLSQMVIIYLCPMNYFTNNFLQLLSWIMIVWFLSISTGVVVYKLRNKYGY